MITLFVAFGALTVAVLVFAAGGSHVDRLTRRACVRLLLWGATGLSLLPGCGGEGHPPPDSPLKRWARLGRIWRDLSAHLRGPRGDWREERDRLIELGRRMQAALEALPAWPDLRLVFEERHAHIKRLLYGGPCYAPLSGCHPMPQFWVEDRVEHLENLVAEGRLSQRAALRAAGVLAIPAEYLVQRGEIEKRPSREWYPALDELDERYCNGTLKAGRPAVLAGHRLVELTVDKLGWLVGPPRQNEGRSEAPVAADVAEEEASP